MNLPDRRRRRISGPRMDRLALCARFTNDIHMSVR